MNIEERVDHILAQLSLREKISLLSGRDLWCTNPIERLGVPAIVMTDGPHGVRADPPSVGGRPVGPATSFPTGVSMAATWDPALIERVGIALAEETRGMGCDILLGPCVNIARTPLAGRNFEAYSEDPYLAGKIGIAWVKGLQSQKVGASLKHFALNNQEFERNRGSSEIDERTMREIYLPQFEMIVKETQPWTVMCSYNRINGIYASENYYLLTEILREEWGFEGAVISDWGANHSTEESVEAGLDLEMPGPSRWYGDLLRESVENWSVDETTINRAARRILKLVLLTGKMDDPNALPKGAVDTPEHRSLARELAEQSITLLKNESGLLPLSKSIKSLAVIGPNAAEARYGGGGSSFVRPPYTISPLEGIKQLLGENVSIGYEPGCSNLVEPQLFDPSCYVQADGITPGLKAEYYNNASFSGEVIAADTEPNMDVFYWNPSMVPAGVNLFNLSAVWTGKFIAPYSGTFNMVLVNTNHCKIYLDGKLLIDNDTGSLPIQAIWEDPWQAAKSIVIELEKGKAYDFRAEYSKQNLEVNAGLTLRYLPVIDPEVSIARAVELARNSEAAVIFAGMPTGFESEGKDRPNMDLPGLQAELIRAVHAVNPNTVVVVHAGSPVHMPWADEIPALLLAYYPGQEGGAALANILFGEVNPSGKLTITLPKRYKDNPTYVNYPGTKEVLYGEGIFVGYRYYDAKNIEPLFPFGHGLSYTTFAYSDLVMPSSFEKGENLHLSFKITNTGKMEGKEIAQVYVRDVKSSLVRPIKELKAFQKVALKPGETRVISLNLDERAFAYYNPYQHAWVAEPGEFEILICASSRDLRLQGQISMV